MSSGANREATRRATLGAGGDWRRRLLLHHAPLAAATAGALVLLTGTSPFVPRERSILTGAFSISMVTRATGDIATILLALTLLVGPANLLFRRRNPLSSYLRRDVGTWTVIVSVVHVIVGFQVRGDGRPFRVVSYFVADGRPLTDSFGLGNWAGLAAMVLVTGLLAISTDHSVRELKAKRWKSLQRLNYTLFGLVIAHAAFYDALSQAASPYTRLLFFTVLSVFVGQMTGIWLYRRRSRAQTVPGVSLPPWASR